MIDCKRLPAAESSLKQKLYLEVVLKIKTPHFAKKCLILTAVILIMSKKHLASERRDPSLTDAPRTCTRTEKI